MRILLLEAGDERSAINILAEPQIPGLDNAGNEYHEDVSNLGKQRLSPGLDRIGKYRNLLEASPDANKWVVLFR